MAPEVMVPEEKANYTDKIDIFSFGFLLYEMWFGQHPFYHDMENGM